MGPPRFYNSIRPKGRHKLLKNYANTTKNRQNLDLSLTIKNQLMLAFRLFTKQGFKNSLKFGKEIGHAAETKELAAFKHILDIYSLQSCKFVSSVRVKGTLYKKDYIIRVGEEFGKINAIAIEGENVYFLYHKLIIKFYDLHLCAYCIEATNNSNIINQNRLKNYHPTLVNRLSDGFSYIVHRILYND